MHFEFTEVGVYAAVVGACYFFMGAVMYLNCLAGKRLSILQLYIVAVSCMIPGLILIAQGLASMNNLPVTIVLTVVPTPAVIVLLLHALVRAEVNHFSRKPMLGGGLAPPPPASDAVTKGQVELNAAAQQAYGDKRDAVNESTSTERMKEHHHGE